ncbi:hypothetical protein LSAT2_014030 [Lamellibrachia satsuma]|nr:hypothetical protein LSAT2_014030 [Lamellibrachia satsuma]
MRPGAVACISIVVTHFTVNDDLVVIARDTLFYGDFNLNEIINKFHGFQRLDAEASLVLYCPCFYILSQHSLPLLRQFLLDTQDSPMTKRDAPGSFIKYLYKRKPIYAAEISGRFDVGSLQSYIVCNEHFRNRESMKPSLPQ